MSRDSAADHRSHKDKENCGKTKFKNKRVFNKEYFLGKFNFYFIGIYLF